jgi:hypothetical protein
LLSEDQSRRYEPNSEQAFPKTYTKGSHKRLFIIHLRVDFGLLSGSLCATPFVCC